MIIWSLNIMRLLVIGVIIATYAMFVVSMTTSHLPKGSTGGVMCDGEVSRNRRDGVFRCRDVSDWNSDNI